MTEIRSSERAAAEVSQRIIEAGKKAKLSTHPFSPPYNDLPVQDSCDRNYTDIAHLTNIASDWCRYLGEDVLEACSAFSSIDAANGRAWRKS